MVHLPAESQESNIKMSTSQELANSQEKMLKYFFKQYFFSMIPWETFHDVGEKAV